MTKRRATLTVHARRLTGAEIAQHWFRRGQEYKDQIRKEYPDFPQAGPDGLFLLSAVEAWFDRFHGRKQPVLVAPEDEEEEAMRAASGKR
jgi:hypothetical protein